MVGLEIRFDSDNSMENEASQTTVKESGHTQFVRTETKSVNNYTMRHLIRVPLLEPVTAMTSQRHNPGVLCC